MNPKRRYRLKGFTLIEVLIAVAIIGILAAIAYPSYQEQVRKSRRTDATGPLSSLANHLEKYGYDHNGSFTGATVAGLLGAAASPEGYYTISISSLNATSYEIQATPVSGKSQANDTECATFVLRSTGARDVSGSCRSSAGNCVSRCW